MKGGESVSRYFIVPQSINYSRLPEGESFDYAITSDNITLRVSTNSNTTGYIARILENGTVEGLNIISLITVTTGDTCDYAYSSTGGSPNVRHNLPLSQYGTHYYYRDTLSSNYPTNLTYLIADADCYLSVSDFIADVFADKYPITYHYENSTVSGPSEAAVGDTVTVSAVPDTDYGITDPTTQISVTNNDDPVNFTWDASTNRITFTMPDPI